MARRFVYFQGAAQIQQFPSAAFPAYPDNSNPNWWEAKIFRKMPLAWGSVDNPTAIDLNLRQSGVEAMLPLVAQFRPNNDWIAFGEGDDDPNSGDGFSLYYARAASGYTMTVDYNEIASAIGGVATLYPWELSQTGFRGHWDADWAIADFRFNRIPGDPLLWGSVVLDRNGIVDIQVANSTNLDDLPNHYVFPSLSVMVPAYDRLGRLAYCAIDRSKILWQDNYFNWRMAYADGSTYEMTIADPRLSSETVDEVLGGWTAAWEGTTDYFLVPGSGPYDPYNPNYRGRRLRITGGEIWLDSEMEIGWPDNPVGYWLEDLWLDLY